MKQLLTRIAAGVTVIMAFGLCAGAETLDQVQARMKERVAAIETLKAAKIVGENNLGYLEFVGAKKEQEALVAAENADRKVVYQAIAAETRTSVETVGKRRALKIAEVARRGTLVQAADGKWAEKK